MRIASIDIGTNTVLLLVAEIEKGTIKPVSNFQEIARLGRYIDESGSISREAFENLADIISKFKSIAVELGVEKIFAFGTSAFREAKNGAELAEFIKAKTSVDVKILSGEEEAMATYKGALSGLSNSLLNSKVTVIDIGGGSTEVIIGENLNIKNFASLDVGTVKLTKNFLKHQPPLTSEIENAREYLIKEFRKISNFEIENSNLVGVAATVTTISAFDLGLKEYNGEKVNEHRVGIEKIKSLCKLLSSLSREEIEDLSPIFKDRGDVIFAGVLILHEFMNLFNFAEIITSDRGVRYGVLFEFML